MPLWLRYRAIRIRLALLITGSLIIGDLGIDKGADTLRPS